MAHETCANCSETSVFEVGDPGALPIFLCSEHLPEHLTTRVATGHFVQTGEFKGSDHRPEDPNPPKEES